MKIIPDELTILKACSELDTIASHPPLRHLSIIGAQFGGKRLRTSIDTPSYQKIPAQQKNNGILNLTKKTRE